MSQTAVLENETSAYEVTKDVSEVYRIRLDSHRCQWANITINSSGDFSAITDCGNFNYAWRGYGDQGFKAFLLRIMSKSGGRGSYVYDKISDDNRNRVDCEKTIAPMKKEFMEKYREFYKDKRRDAKYMQHSIYDHKAKWAFDDLRDKARSTWDALLSLENEGELSSDRFYSIIWESSNFDDLFFDGDYFAHCIDVEFTSDRQAITFCEVVAPVFAEILRKEIKEDSHE
jgi:hypothetical protein